MSAGLLASTVTPGRTAPVASLTSPAIAPLKADCAHPDDPDQRENERRGSTHERLDSHVRPPKAVCDSWPIAHSSAGPGKVNGQYDLFSRPDDESKIPEPNRRKLGPRARLSGELCA